MKFFGKKKYICSSEIQLHYRIQFSQFPTLQRGTGVGGTNATINNHEMPSSDSLFQLESVWPDLAKYHHFGKYLKTFGNIFKVDLVLEKVFNSLWHNLFAIGQVFNAENGQILKAQFGHLVTLIGILFFNLGSGCAPVGREVASDSRSLRFESCLWQKFILNIYSQLYWKDENKEKEDGNGPNLTIYYLVQQYNYLFIFCLNV